MITVLPTKLILESGYSVSRGHATLLSLMLLEEPLLYVSNVTFENRVYFTTTD